VPRLLSCVTPAGKDVYVEWQNGLRDTRAKVAAERRLVRVKQGNFGDHKYLQDGVWELRIDVGAGYRIYYAPHGSDVVILLCGGDEGSQVADIARAIRYLKEVKELLNEPT
jgi:putative addiction module killer protein